ncbi:MAG: hypothetical protein U0L26_14625 [Cellulosilyticum sp.]|nr:hypothetical protein [Cellulosilyticum sp.]MEE1073588.1 hypothetical protein [Cellulosilyticum sp.]
MEIKQLDKLAKEKAPMPNGLPMHEQCYYIASRGLYDQYEKKIITLEEAKKEKQEVIKTYELGKDQWQLFLGMHEIAEKLKKLREDQFNTGIEFEVLELIDRFLK